MIAVDTNILVYAHDAAAELHAPAKARLQAMARGRARWGIPWFCLGEFVRVVTHRRVFARPFTGAEACAAVRRLVAA